MKVLGCGNINMGDDGFGIEILKDLLPYEKEWDLNLIEVNWGGISILDHFEGDDKVIILDAVKFGSTPGSIFCFSLEEIPDKIKKVFLSSHDIGVLEAIHMGKKICPERMPGKILFIGVEVEATDAFSMEISPAVRSSFSKVTELIHQEALAH